MSNTGEPLNIALPNVGNKVAEDIPTIAEGFQKANDGLKSHLLDYAPHVPFGGTSTNSGNNYSIATPAIDSLVEGMAVSFRCNADSTGATTLNWDGKGAKSIKKANGTDVTNLKNGGIYTLRYDGTNFILQGEGASGNATASDLLSGKTATVDAGEITGTMPNRGTVNITPSTADQVIQEGYHNGSGKVFGDSDLIANNIIGGVNLFGITGTAKRTAIGSVVINGTGTHAVTLGWQPKFVTANFNAFSNQYFARWESAYGADQFAASYGDSIAISSFTATGFTILNNVSAGPHTIYYHAGER